MYYSTQDLATALCVELAEALWIKPVVDQLLTVYCCSCPSGFDWVGWTQLHCTMSGECSACYKVSFNRNIDYVEGIFPFEAAQADELSFLKGTGRDGHTCANQAAGDVIEVLRRIDAQWFEGRHLDNGSVGIFPSEFVKSTSPPAASGTGAAT